VPTDRAADTEDDMETSDARPGEREGAIWDLLKDRSDYEGVAEPRGGRGARGGRDAWVPILDAALGVLAATRHLVEVTEEVVREQRDRMADRPSTPERPPTKIDLSY
jgi:hypothetical protein